jgi:hypothetical protein
MVVKHHGHGRHRHVSKDFNIDIHPLKRNGGRLRLFFVRDFHNRDPLRRQKRRDQRHKQADAK